MSRWHRTEFDFLPDRAFQPRAGGGMTLEGSSGGGGSTMAQNITAMRQAQLSEDQLQWAKEIYAQEQPARQQATVLANQVAQQQLKSAQIQDDVAQTALDDYRTTYRPIEQRLAAEAMSYDTPERRAAASDAAVADVETRLAAEQAASQRELQRAGVQPGSGKAQALAASMDLGAAKLKAGAGNAASQQVATVGRAMLSDAANLGRGIASSQATNAQLAANLGTNAVGTTGAGLAAGTGGSGIVQNAYGTAISGLGSAGSQFAGISAAQRQAAADQNKSNQQTAAGVATLAAMFI